MALLKEIIDIEHLTHGARVEMYSVSIAKQLKMSNKELEMISTCALLHDIGKKKIPSSILNKKGPLTKEERAIIEKHPIYSCEYLLSSDYPKTYAHIVRAHHEKIDGSGYPDKLVGEQIPIHARIITVADIFDALTSNRPYRAAYNNTEAIDIMKVEALDGKIDKDIFKALQKVVEISLSKFD